MSSASTGQNLAGSRDSCQHRARHLHVVGIIDGPLVSLMLSRDGNDDLDTRVHLYLNHDCNNGHELCL